MTIRKKRPRQIPAAASSIDGSLGVFIPLSPRLCNSEKSQLPRPRVELGRSLHPSKRGGGSTSSTSGPFFPSINQFRRGNRNSIRRNQLDCSKMPIEGSQDSTQLLPKHAAMKAELEQITHDYARLQEVLFVLNQVSRIANFRVA